MVVLVDKTRAVDITIREWGDEHGYGSDWSAAALDVGGCRRFRVSPTGRMTNSPS